MFRKVEPVERTDLETVKEKRNLDLAHHCWPEFTLILHNGAHALQFHQRGPRNYSH